VLIVIGLFSNNLPPIWRLRHIAENPSGVTPCSRLLTVTGAQSGRCPVGAGSGARTWPLTPSLPGNRNQEGGRPGGEIVEQVVAVETSAQAADLDQPGPYLAGLGGDRDRSG